MQNTVIYVPVRPDLIERSLDTLYRHTVPNFKVIVVDQTVDGLNANYFRDKFKNLTMIRTPKSTIYHTGNLGFAKANNLAISLVDTPYFTLCNDDVEFVSRAWWWGVLRAFDTVDEATPDRPCMMVCPGSIKLPDWSVGRPSGDDFYILPYKTRYSQEEYDSLVNEDHYVNEHLTLKPESVIDGVTLYCPVIKTELFLDVGLLDESYWPGGAEDYDYACRLSMRGYRGVGTTMSWVFHHWSKSLADTEAEKIREQLNQPELRMGDHNKIWGKDEDGKNYHDIWGVECRGCKNARVRTTDNVTGVCPECGWEFKIPQAVIRPL